MDFVHRQPSLAAQATGGVVDLARELRLSVVEKLHQIDKTLEQMLSSAHREQYRRCQLSLGIDEVRGVPTAT